MGSCVTRPGEARRTESSAIEAPATTTVEHRLPPPPQQQRQSPPGNTVSVAPAVVVRSPESNDGFIVPSAAAASGDSRTSADVRVVRRRSKSAGESIVTGGTASRDVVAHDQENDSECAVSPHPTSPLALRSPNVAERTSHASTVTLTEETSHTRPESLAAHAGSNADDISYDTDATMLEESAKFSSIPLVPRDSTE